MFSKVVTSLVAFLRNLRVDLTYHISRLSLENVIVYLVIVVVIKCHDSSLKRMQLALGHFFFRVTAIRIVKMLHHNSFLHEMSGLDD